jgi:ABC-type Fe3+/spermidine/putrescine transport system ATPase subunit
LSFAINYRLTTPIELHAAFEVRGFTALLGRSGAGKTSLLKAVAGLLPADGTPWAGLAPQARPVGYMPQGAALFPHLTVLENAAFALRGPGRLRTAQTLLDALGIGALGARSAATLSGGEAQRAALARALARKPALLLLDEPSAGLDAATRDSVVAQLAALIGAQQIPALAATHDPAIAGLADWIALLADGRIIQQGTPRDVFANPASIAAAKLLGYQNFWVRDGVGYAIRAEDVEIAESGTPATIIAVRNHGLDMRLSCTIPEPLTILMRGAGNTSFAPGQVIQVNFPPAALKLLPI